MDSSDAFETFSARLDKAVKEAGGSAVVAQRAGVSKSSVDNWRKGGADPSLSNVMAVAAAAGVDFYWLATGETKNIHMSLGDLQQAIEDRGQAHVPRLDVAVSAGHGSFVDQARMIDMVPFSMDFFTRRLGKGPEGMVIVDARGDSMSPTIADRDQVMIDTGDTLLADAVWAFTLDEDVYVKRLLREPGGLRMISDNQDYPSVTLSAHETLRLQLIGRVVWVGRVF